MPEPLDINGGVVLLDDLQLPSARPDPVVQFEASVVSALRAEYAEYRHAGPRTMARICMAAAYAHALGVPRWIAQSQRDYVAGVLGVKHSTFCHWVKMGRVLWTDPSLREQLQRGRITLQALERLASGATTAAGRASDKIESVAKAESEARLEVYPKSQTKSEAETKAESAHETEPQAGTEPGTEWTTLSISAPVPAVLYLEDTMRLARGVVGISDGDEDALSALLAEASTECTRRVDVAIARRRFRVHDRNAHHAEDRNTDRTDDHTDDYNTDEIPPPTLDGCVLRIPHRGEEAQRRAAHQMHVILARLIARRDRLAVRQSDQLLEWQIDGLHERSGFPNFERFAREILGVAPGTCREHLRHARQRRREHPIAIALRDGQISSVKAELLERMWREARPPLSDLAAWCEYAQQYTVRWLRRAVRWAKQQSDLDYRRWSLAHCPPPRDDELRTLDHSLESLVRETGEDELAEALVRWNLAPKATMRFLVTRETRDELLVQMAAMQDQVRGQDEFLARRPIPDWLAACRVLGRARHAWMVHHQSPPVAQRRILDRDGYQCAAPECTQRRNLHVHHVSYSSQGGGDEDANRVTLCAFHHLQGEHGGLLRVRGKVKPNGSGLTWEMGLRADGTAMFAYRDERMVATRY